MRAARSPRPNRRALARAVFGGRERRASRRQIGEREPAQQRIELGETRRQPA